MRERGMVGPKIQSTEKADGSHGGRFDTGDAVSLYLGQGTGNPAQAHVLLQHQMHELKALQNELEMLRQEQRLRTGDMESLRRLSLEDLNKLEIEVEKGLRNMRQTKVELSMARMESMVQKQRELMRENTSLRKKLTELARRHNHGHGMERDLGREDNFVNNSSLSSASSSFAEGEEGKEVEEEDEDDGPKEYKRVRDVVDSISLTRSSSSSDTRQNSSSFLATITKK